MGASRRSFSTADLLHQRRAMSACPSPDGRRLVFVIKQPDLAENRNELQLFERRLDGDAPLRRLTTAGTVNCEPAFSPDGSLLAFTSNRSGERQIWLLPSAGGEARQLTRLPGGASRPVWFPGGERLLVISSVFADASAEADVKARIEAAKARKATGRVIDGLMFRHWDSWREGRVDHVFVVDAESGEARDLTPGPWPAPPLSLSGPPDYAPSADGRQVFFTSVRDADLARSTNVNIWRIPADGEAPPERVSPGDGCNVFPSPSPCGRFLAFCAMERAGYEADRLRLVCLDLQRGALLEVAPGFDRSVMAPTWTPDGQWLLFAAEDEGKSRLWRVPAAGGTPEPLTDGATDRGLALLADGAAAVFERQDLLGPPDLYAVPTAGGAPRRLTSLNAEALAEVELQDGEDFWYEGAGGLRCHGLIVRPPGFEPNKRYPVVFLIHGGPQGAFGRDFHERWNAQLFAAPGYVVVLLNPRGSTGFGQAMTDAIRGEWGGACYDDLARGFDHVLAHFPFCDPERLAAAGASFGGFMVNWIAAHDHRFRCLVSHDGIFNTEMMEYLTDELWFTEWEFEGTPWEHPEAYRRYSPHRFVESMQTPMLVVQGEQDFRCTTAEGLGLFTALQRRGVPSRLLWFPDEGHWVVKPANRELWWSTVHEWLARWLA
ncbi:MAG: S9 family peptidase [Pseudomonadota bacterium]